jgi:hypothetical protein
LSKNARRSRRAFIKEAIETRTALRVCFGAWGSKTEQIPQSNFSGIHIHMAE